MADNHLWFSIFAFHMPSAKRFTRVQRCTCCFVLLFISLLMNIYYYDTKQDLESNKVEQSSLNIGPFYFSKEQVEIKRSACLAIFHWCTSFFDTSVVDRDWCPRRDNHLLAQFAAGDVIPPVKAAPSSSDLSGCWSRWKDSQNIIARSTCDEPVHELETKVSLSMVVCDCCLRSLCSLCCCFDILRCCSWNAVR